MDTKCCANCLNRGRDETTRINGIQHCLLHKGYRSREQNCIANKYMNWEADPILVIKARSNQ